MALIHLSVHVIRQPGFQDCQPGIEYLGLIACGFPGRANHG